MEKQQHAPACGPGAGVHLPRTAARRVHQPIAQGTGDRAGSRPGCLHRSLSPRCSGHAAVAEARAIARSLSPRRAPGRRPRSSAEFTAARTRPGVENTRTAPHPHGWATVRRRESTSRRLSSALRRNCSPAPRCSRNSDRGSLSTDPRRRSKTRSADMRPRRSVEPHRQSEHLIEIAVERVALPVDADGTPAHHVLDVRLDVGGPQHLEVPVELPLRYEDAAEPADRHVRERQQPVEPDSESPAKVRLVVAFKLSLRRRQHRTLRIEDEVEGEIGPLLRRSPGN